MESYFFTPEICTDYLNNLRLKDRKYEKTIRSAYDLIHMRKAKILEISRKRALFSFIDFDDESQKVFYIDNERYVLNGNRAVKVGSPSGLKKKQAKSHKIEIKLLGNSLLVSSDCGCDKDSLCVHGICAVLMLDNYLRYKPFQNWQEVFNIAVKSFKKSRPAAQEKNGFLFSALRL